MDKLKLFMIEEVCEKKGYISIDDFREMIAIMPGLTAVLPGVLEENIASAVAYVKAKGLRYSYFNQLIKDYETYIHREQVSGHRTIRGHRQSRSM